MNQPDTLKLLINGARGRMGQAIVACADKMPEVEIAATVDVGDDLMRALPACDVVIDFSHHEAATLVSSACAEAGKAVVIGTTGHDDGQLAAIRKASAAIPVVLAPNFSVGVNALFWLTRKAAEILGTDFDLEIVEMHHRQKKDAPSGTARRLAEILADVRSLDYTTNTLHGRHGITAGRTSQEIGMHALRGGDVVGDHTVIFAGLGERLELTHKASSRDTFALGSLRAALWIRGRAPGLYDMQDVLGLR